MSEQPDPALLASARNGDHEAFRQLIEPFRRELLVHCYRILGSLEDAEDALQETWLRAWRRLNTFEGRATLRAWLYKIATNASLDARGSRRNRSLPTLTIPASDPRDPLPAPDTEPHWLEPFPDVLLPDAADSPEAIYDARESVSLAFLAALQHLPGRQRAVLILREVLDWRAGEVANLLEMTDAAVNSALQRARATMQRSYKGGLRADVASPTSDERTTTLLANYVQAWEMADPQRLASLLREDAALTMPPFPAWFRGPSAIASFLDGLVFAGDATDRFRLIATRANACPAFAVYQRNESGDYGPSALNVLMIVDGQISEMHDFLVFDDRLFSRFGLPPTA